MKRPPVFVVQLVHILGPMKGQIQEFTDANISIGRHPSSHLRFPADLASISRHHAEIIREGNQFKLVDHSTNGTFVNGKRITETLLKNGDVITFAEEGGPKVSFLTQLKEESAERASIPPQPAFREEPAERIRIEGRPRPVSPIKERPVEVPVQSAKIPLIIQYGPTLRSFKELPISIGKSSKCHFRLEHPSILEYHAQIFFSQNQYWIKDLTGKGLLQINRQPLNLQSPLKLHDDISFGPQGPIFRFIGEGRLVEVSEPHFEPISPPSPSRKERAQEVDRETKSPEKRSSLLKKIFR
ncbi:MAG: FHA domain-containing protein [Deltaproteobacteria bacterium]|nr:FHA domain-containing protein [Deltaproteobacteria bacterium]